MTTTLPSLSKSKHFVEMKAVTWHKDSHGLFDYETKSLSVKKYRLDNPCKIYREDQEIVLVEGKSAFKDENDLKLLTSVQQTSNSQDTLFSINPPTNDVINDNFLIIRSLKNKEGLQKGYALQLGDLLKLGRIEYAIIEIRDQKGSISSIKDLFCTDKQLVQKVNLDASLSKTCKICLFDEQSEDNPFITPCKCKGSCEFVHFQCLKQWIESRGYRKQMGNAIVYKWKKLDCEVCQEPLPKQIDINGKIFYLADIERPDSGYIVLESICKDKKVSKGFVVIKTPLDEPIKLGRGHQCEIRVSDISVSRLHAFIKYENGNFLIIDNNSKFGTLVRVSKPFQVSFDKMAIQVGRTVLTFVLKNFQNLNVGFDLQQTKFNFAQSKSKLRVSENGSKNMTQSHGPNIGNVNKYQFHNPK